MEHVLSHRYTEGSDNCHASVVEVRSLCRDCRSNGNTGRWEMYL